VRLGKGERRRQSCRAGADNDHIGVVVGGHGCGSGWGQVMGRLFARKCRV
jgi:hypothetical protein